MLEIEMPPVVHGFHRPRLGPAIDIVPAIKIFTIEERLEIFGGGDGIYTRQGPKEKIEMEFHKVIRGITICPLWKTPACRAANSGNTLQEKAPPTRW